MNWEHMIGAVVRLVVSMVHAGVSPEVVVVFVARPLGLESVAIRLRVPG